MIKSSVQPLLRLYRYDEDNNVKRAALRSLAQMRAGSALPILQRLMRSQDRNDKFQALDGFIAWGDDPKVLDMLVTYKNDAVVGSRITSHLHRHGR